MEGEGPAADQNVCMGEDEVSRKYCENTRMSTAEGGRDRERGERGRRKPRGGRRGVKRVHGEVDRREMREQRRRGKHHSLSSQARHNQSLEDLMAPDPPPPRCASARGFWRRGRVVLALCN